MNNSEFFNKARRIYLTVALFFLLILIGAVGLMYKIINPSFLIFDNNNEITNEEYIDVEDFDKIENGIHLATGFKNDEDLPLVIASCTPCHSAKLVTQNRATKEGWISIIRWMQETQNLWDLGQNEDLIITYLAKNYGPEEKGRRNALTNIEWYDLED